MGLQNLPYAYKETGFYGCYEIGNTELVSKGFYAFELSDGAKIASWSYTDGTNVIAEGNATLMFNSMANSGSMGGLYFLPEGIRGTQIQLSTGKCKLWLCPSGSVYGIAISQSIA